MAISIYIYNSKPTFVVSANVISVKSKIKNNNQRFRCKRHKLYGWDYSSTPFFFFSQLLRLLSSHTPSMPIFAMFTSRIPHSSFSVCPFDWLRLHPYHRPSLSCKLVRRLSPLWNSFNWHPSVLCCDLYLSWTLMISLSPTYPELLFYGFMWSIDQRFTRYFKRV